MAKTVGYACSIKLSWLKRAYDMLEEKYDEETFKNELNDYLSFEIDSPTRLRKTREILMNIWYYNNEPISQFRKEACNVLEKHPEHFVPVSLCLIYLAYPVVVDICKYMGRLFETHDEITNAMLKQKLYDAWGERGTLETTARRVTLTLKELGIISEIKRTRYSLIKSELTNNDVISFILSVAMRIDNGSYYSFSELGEFDILFPFEFNVSKEHILADKNFMATHFAGEMTISLRE